MTRDRRAPKEYSRDGFMRALGVTRQHFFRLRQRGVLPPPPRLPGSRIIRWTEPYLEACRRALEKNREANRRRLRLKAKDIRKAGLI